MDFDWKINGNQYQATREGYNLLDLTSLIGKTETKDGITYKINEDCSITVNGAPTDYTSFNLLDMSLKAGTYKFVDGLNSGNVFLQTIGDFQDTSQNHTFSLAEDGSSDLYLVILAGTPALNNVTLYPMIQEGTEDKPYEQYGASPSPDYPSEIKTVKDSVEIKVVNNDNTKSQTAIMPVQQEMLEGDYIADVEYHEWEKIIIDTSKLIEDSTNEEGKKRYRYGYDKNIKKSDATNNVAYSNMFKLIGNGQTFFNVKGFTIVNNTIYIYDEGESLTEFKSKITDKQLVFYAQLETSINLELTSEQKAIRDTKLYTYKNITNIDVSNELASIDVTYKKDLETMFNNIIKQIPSNTSDTAET